MHGTGRRNSCFTAKNGFDLNDDEYNVVNSTGLLYCAAPRALANANFKFQEVGRVDFLKI